MPMTMKFRLAILIVLMVTALADFLGCYPALRPLSDRTMIGGRRAGRVQVVLAGPFSFKHVLTTYTLPAGRYVPQNEDDLGVYFGAPSEITSSELFASPSLDNGELYFRIERSGEVDLYTIVRNRLRFVSLPESFKYSVDQ
jgi:hypothetical protein